MVLLRRPSLFQCIGRVKKREGLGSRVIRGPNPCLPDAVYYRVFFLSFDAILIKLKATGASVEYIPSISSVKLRFSPQIKMSVPYQFSTFNSSNPFKEIVSNFRVDNFL